MKKLLILLMLVAGCDATSIFTVQKEYPPAQREYPIVNPPISLRQNNWLAYNRYGSCVWASTVTLLHWQGRSDLAEAVRRTCSGGTTWVLLQPKFDQLGIDYAMTTQGNIDFLEWAVATRRGAAVVVEGGRHMVNLVDMTEDKVALLDNNYTSKIYWVDREAFIQEWRASSGWAFSPVYSPTPPLP